MNSNWIIETNQLTKKYGQTRVVNHLDLKVKQGEIYGFLGPNGAGKTTTIRMLLGLIKPSKGSIHLFGKDLKNERKAILKQVGSLVEYPSYYGHLNAYENLETARLLLDVPKSRIAQVLDIVRLTKDAKRPVKSYSLGMKQRLGIALALLGNPKLLILDEPTNGLDPSGIIEIRELIKSMPKEHGMTVVVSSHLLSEIDQMATQVGILSKGRMIFQDDITKLRQRATSRIQLTVNDSEKAWQTLLANGYPVERQQEQLFLKSTSNDLVATAVATLVQQQFDIYRVVEEKKSLEEIFLQLTGKEGGL